MHQSLFDSANDRRPSEHVANAFEEMTRTWARRTTIALLLAALAIALSIATAATAWMFWMY